MENELNILRDGDILLCKGTGLIPTLIRWGTKSVYSHVAVIASAKLGLVIEAIPQGGVRAIYFKNFNVTHDIYRVKKEYPYNHSGVVSFLIAMLARKYDFKSAIKLGWKMFLRRMKLVKLLGLKIINQKVAVDKLQKDQDFFCSELCYEAFYFGGTLDIVPGVADGDATSPGDIASSKVVEKITA